MKHAYHAQRTHERHVGGVEVDDEGVVVRGLEARHVLQVGTDIALGVVLDVLEGVHRVLGSQWLAVRPHEILTQVVGDGQGVIGGLPALGRIRHDLRVHVELGQAVEHVLDDGPGVVIGKDIGAPRCRVTGLRHDDGVPAVGKRDVCHARPRRDPGRPGGRKTGRTHQADKLTTRDLSHAGEPLGAVLHAVHGVPFLLLPTRWAPTRCRGYERNRRRAGRRPAAPSRAS